MEDCIFCKIVKGELPANSYYEDDFVIAIKPLNEVSKGHTLVIPKKHSGNIFDIEDEDLKKVIIVAKNLSKKILKENQATGVNLLNANGKDAQQSVFHFHMHIIPRYPKDDALNLWINEGK